MNTKLLKGKFRRLDPDGSMFFMHPSLLDLPNENLTEIGYYLERQPTDLRNYMTACSRTSGAWEYVRYNTIVVSGKPGCRLLTMLASGTRTATRYCKRIRRLWFRGWHDTDMFLNSELLSETLPLLTSLRTLWIEATPVDTEHLIERLAIEGVIRRSEHPAFSAFATGEQSFFNSPLTLPNLRYLRLSGEFSIHSIAAHRALTELDLNCLMDAEELTTLLSSVEGTLLGQHVEYLSLRLVKELDLEFGIPLASQAFPNLSGLSFEQSSLDFAKFIQVMASDQQSFPQIKYIVLNERLAHPLAAISQTLAIKIPQTEDIEPTLRRIHTTRFKFECIGLGKVRWRLGDGGRYWRDTVTRSNNFWKDKFGQQFATKFYPSIPHTFITYAGD